MHITIDVTLKLIFPIIVATISISAGINILYEANAVSINKSICPNPTIPIANVFPIIIFLGVVDVTNVSITLDVFSLDTETATVFPYKYTAKNNINDAAIAIP